MTNRKAIEAGMKRLRDEAALLGKPNPDSVEKEIGCAYEAGRAAGRKETIAQLPGEGLIRAWETKRKLRQWANALAKKAREK